MNLFRTSLSVQMAIATLLGIFVGLFFGDLCVKLGPLADAYIMILKITAVPYLIVAIMHGLGLMNHEQGKSILKKGFFFIILAWIINIVIIYCMTFLFPQDKGIRQASFVSQKATSINFAELLIPDNIFYSLTNNIIPAVVVFSLLIGLSLMHIKEKKEMMALLGNTVDSLTRVTTWISRITPLGTFIIIANQVGTIQFSTIKQIGTYIILYIVGISFIVFWIIPRLVSMLTPLHASKWIKDMVPILILAYTTNVVIVVLPYIIQLIQKESHELFPYDEKVLTPTQGVVSIVFNLPLGALFVSFFVLFASIFYQFPLSLGNQIELFATTFLTGLGSIGIGSWINSLTFLLESLGLPLDGINLYLTTIPFTAGFQSMVSAMEIASISLLITLAYRNLIVYRWRRLVKGTVSILVPLILVIGGVKSFNPLPRIYNVKKNIDELSLRSDVKVTIYTPETPPPLNPVPPGDLFDQILENKLLRVGYFPCVPPFSFYNKFGQVVGYDMAFAYELAHDLGCDLELIPLDYSRLAEELESGIYDIAMSAVSITEERLKSLNFSKPYASGKFVFVTRNNEPKESSRLPLKPDIKIAVLKGSSFETLAHQLFPNQTVVPLETYESFTQKNVANLLLWEELEAISWVLNHPHFKVIFPSPPLGEDSFGYPVKASSMRLLNFLNQWLVLKKNEGFSGQQYDLWVLRKTESTLETKPRWSIWNDWIKPLRQNP
jgi:proton glutamate symport protein